MLGSLATDTKLAPGESGFHFDGDRMLVLEDCRLNLQLEPSRERLGFGAHGELFSLADGVDARHEKLLLCATNAALLAIRDDQLRSVHDVGPHVSLDGLQELA